MLFTWCVILILFGAHGAAALEPASKPVRTVQGRVVTADGEPVAGAAVWVRPAEDLEWQMHGYGIGSKTETDEAGEFLFRHVWRWEDWPILEVEARAPGWAPALARVPAGRGADDLVLVLDRGARLSGRLVDDSGDPISDAPIRLYAEAERLSERILVSSSGFEPDFEAVTEADGTFTLTTLPDDRFEVLVDPPGFARRVLRSVEIPGSGEVDLGRIVLEPSSRITGHVLDAQDRPLTAARVTLLPAGATDYWRSGWIPLEVSGGRSVEVDETGRFVFEDVPPNDRFVLHAVAPERRAAVADAAAGATAPVELVLRPAARLFGRVEDPSEGAVPGVWVQLRDLEEGGFLQIPIQTKMTDEGGHFTFEGLAPGRYGIALGRAVLEDVEIRQTIELAEGEERGPVVLTQENRARLEVTTVSPMDEPIEGAEISIQRSDGPPHEALSDERGRSLFDDLPPGQVVISASHEALGTQQETTTLRPGHNEVSLVLESGGHVRGRVVDPEGAPIANASVRLEPLRGLLSAYARSGEDGSFVLRAPSPGSYRLRVEADGWAATDLESLEVGVEALEGMEVRLHKGTELVGRVHGIGPDELARVTVSASSVSSRRRVQGAVAHDGNYRLSGLEPGAWVVTGELREPRRMVQEEIHIDAQQEQAELDLLFAQGHRLTGVVRRRSEPISGAMLVLWGQGIVIEDRTDSDGSFRIVGLESGEYRLRVSIFGTDVSMDKKLSVTADRALEIDLPTSRISGRLLTPDGKPLTETQVQALPLDGGHPAQSMYSRATTQEDGHFVLPLILEGSYRLVARAPAVGSMAKKIEVAGAEMDLGDLRLETGRALAFRPRSPDGSPVESIGVILLDTARVPLAGDQASVGPDGIARIPQVAEAARSAVVFSGIPDPFTAPVEVTIPLDVTQPVPVAFPVGSQILVRRPGAESSRAAVKLRNTEGHIPPRIEFNPFDGYPIEGEEHAFGSLLPGTWTVELRTEDGEIESREVTTRPGETTEVVFGDTP